MILMIISLFLLSVSLIGMGINGYILWRNDKVFDFRLKIIYAFSPANWSEAKKLYEKYSYNDMLFSLKSLKLEAWFTEEEIKILKGETDGN